MLASAPASFAADLAAERAAAAAAAALAGAAAAGAAVVRRATSVRSQAVLASSHTQRTLSTASPCRDTREL